MEKLSTSVCRTRFGFSSAAPILAARIAFGVFILCSASDELRAEDEVVAPEDSQGRNVFSYSVESAVVPPTKAAQPTPATSAPARTVSQPARQTGNEMPAEFQSLVQSISETHGVDPHLVAAMMKTESNFNPFARSPKGARGLMQLIPETGKRFGVRDFFDPKQNIEGGVRYLKFLLDKFDGDIDLTLAAYNAGEGLVERLGRVPAIKETKEYVRKVRSYYATGPRLTAALPPVVKSPVTAPAAAVRAPEAASKEAGKEPASEPAASSAPTEPAPVVIEFYRSVDERGVTHYSTNGP